MRQAKGHKKATEETCHEAGMTPTGGDINDLKALRESYCLWDQAVVHDVALPQLPGAAPSPGEDSPICDKQ